MNLLAANTHEPAGWSSGSGIYSSDGPRAYYHEVGAGSGGRLLLAPLPIHPARRHTDWSGWAWDNLDRIPARPEAEFSEVVYGDTYTLVPLQGNQSAVKVGATLCNVCALQPVPGVQVCTEAGEFCCMAEWTRLEGEEVFSLGVYSGPHYLDASVTGSWSLQMCTVIKVENCCY